MQDLPAHSLGHTSDHSPTDRPPEYPSGCPANWVVFRLSALGDVVLATGVLRYWNKAYGWRFRVLTKTPFASVFENHPAVDSVITPTAAELAMPGLVAGFGEIAERHTGWGLLDLHGTTRSRLLAMRWKGIVRRYPKRSLARRAFLLTGGLAYKESLRALNVPQRYSLAVETVPPPAEALVPVLYLADTERAWAKSFLASLFRDDVLKNPPDAAFPQRCVAIHPFAAHAHKAWPKAHYERLVSLLDANGIPWLVIGRGEPFFPADRRDLTGKTTVRESAALIASCSALVTGDSGPMHLGTAVGTPVVAMFGPTTKEWGFFPSGPRDQVLETDLACRPCSLHGKKGCPHSGKCLARIAPETVLAAVEDVLPAIGGCTRQALG